MSFLLNIKAYTNKLNSVAKEMDEKVEEYVNQAIDKMLEYDEEFFSRNNNEEVDKSDMKATLKKLFSLFDVQPKKKNINGYIFFTKETRADCSKRNPNMSPTEITSALSQEWKALDQTERDEWNLRAKSVAPQTEEEKRAKRSSSKKPSQPKVTCDYSGCEKVVKNQSKHSDGCTYCATHFKKVVSDEKKAATPKCKHTDKEGKECKSDALNGEWCSRHMKKPIDEKKEMKSVSKKPVQKDSPKQEPPKTPALSSATDKFNFKKEAPVSISETPEWWTCKAIKLDGVNKNRYHINTGLVLDLTEAKLVGTFINNKAVFLKDVKDDIKEWCKKSGIAVDEEEDIELDEELESEDEE